MTTEYTEYTEKDKRKTGIRKAGATERIEDKSRSRAIDHGIRGKRQEEKMMVWIASVYSVWSVVKKVYGFTLLAILW